MEELIVIHTDNELINLIEYIKTKEFVTIDTETTGLDKSCEIVGYSICCEESKAYYVILAEWKKDKLIYNSLNLLSKSLFRILKDKKLILHNAVYDCKMIASNFKISLIESVHTDTLILAHLLDENRRVGLKELAKEYFGEDSTQEQTLMKQSVLDNGGTYSSDTKEMYKADPILLAEYGAKDALLTYRLFMELIPNLYEQKLDAFFYEESMPLLRGPTYELNTTGLQVDTNRLLTLKKTLQAECEEAKAFIFKEIEPYIKDKYPGTTKKNTFNIGASQQLSWLLFGQLNLEFSTLTDGGRTACQSMGMKLPYTISAKRDFIAICKNNKDGIQQPEALVNGKKVRAKKYKDPWAYIAVDKMTLQKLAPKYKWIERLLEYQKKTKIM